MQAHTYQSARLQARSALAFAMCLDQPGVGLADTVALHFKSATDVGPWCSLSPGSDHKIPDKTLFRGWVALVALAPWLSTSSGTHTRKTFQGPGRERQQASHGAPSVRARARFRPQPGGPRSPFGLRPDGLVEKPRGCQGPGPSSRPSAPERLGDDGARAAVIARARRHPRRRARVAQGGAVALNRIRLTV